MDMALRRVTLGGGTVSLCGRFYCEVLRSNDVNTVLLGELVGKVVGAYGGREDRGHMNPSTSEVRFFICGCVVERMD